MREFLFRGKRTDNGEWEYGDFRIQNDDNPDRANYLKTYIMPRNVVGRIEVIPETVGQFTGLMDKNGVKVFEGDVVKTRDGGIFGIAFGSSTPPPVIEYCKNRWLRQHSVFGLFAYNKNGEYLIEDNKGFKVIGNIHDNPELMEGL